MEPVPQFQTSHAYSLQIGFSQTRVENDRSLKVRALAQPQSRFMRSANLPASGDRGREEVARLFRQGALSVGVQPQHQAWQAHVHSNELQAAVFVGAAAVLVAFLVELNLHEAIAETIEPGTGQSQTGWPARQASFLRTFSLARSGYCGNSSSKDPH